MGPMPPPTGATRGTNTPAGVRLVRPLARLAAWAIIRVALWQHRARCTVCDLVDAWLPMRWHARMCPSCHGDRRRLHGP